MLGKSNGVSRRKVLQTAGGSLAAMSATGLAVAKPDDTVEVNVGFKSDKGRQKALDVASDVVREFNSLDVVTIQAPKKAVTGLDNNPNVRYVEENGTMQALSQSLPWGVDRIDAEVAHANSETGYGIDVAVIDTGIDSDHPDLEPNLGAGKAFVNCNGWYTNCETCYYDWDDDNGHGTRLACLVGAADNAEDSVGVAPDVTLHAVKSLDYNGSGTVSDIAGGIEYVVQQNWDVAILALGADSGSSTLKDAVEYAYQNGVLLVAAAGNSGPCTNCVGYPAAYDECIAVSATDSSDTLSDFSSTGPEIELAAPGEDIYACSCDGGSSGYDTVSGTSFAVPHVAGAGAQVMANGYTNAEARNRLYSTAEDIGLSSDEQGAGLVDVAAAVGLDSSDD